MEFLNQTFGWAASFEWLAIGGLTVAVLTLGWRLRSERRARIGMERERLSKALGLLDELIHSNTADGMLSGLTTPERSGEVMANKKDRQRQILRELEQIARQLPSKNYEGVAHDLLAIINGLNWDEDRAIKVKVKLARVLNPELAKEAKDEHALDDDKW